MGQFASANRLVVGALLAVVLGACGSSDHTFGAVTTDSAGIAITTSDLRFEPDIPRCVVAAEPSLRFGVAEGAPDYEFGEIPSVAVFANGNIAVLDRSAREVRVFGDEGRFMYRAGRRGEGPGEFTDPIRVLAIGGDTLVVWDWDLGRIVTFGPEGRALSTVSLRPRVPNLLAWFVRLPGARPFWFGNVVVDRVPVGTEFIPRNLRVLAVDSTGTVQDTIGEFRQRMVGWVDPATRQTGAPIHDHTTSFAGEGDRIYVAGGDRTQIEVRDAAWRLKRIIRWREGDRAVSREAATEYRQRFLARLPTDADRQRWQPTLDAVPTADSFPTVDELILSSSGTVWARRYRRVLDDSVTFWTFTSDGNFECAARFPPAFRLRAVTTSSILGVQPDADGAPQVVVVPLGRTRP